MPTAPWRKTNFTTTVTGSDASPGSGVARVEYKVDSGSVVTTPAVSITTEGPHTLYTRVVDTAGNVSDWREDAIGIDKTIPTLTVDCGVTTWRNTPATCTVAAAGGVSGLATLTAARGAGVAEPIGGSYAVESDGAANADLPRRRRRRQREDHRGRRQDRPHAAGRRRSAARPARGTALGLQGHGHRRALRA